MPVSVFKRLTHRLGQALATLFGGIFGIVATTSTIVPEDGGAGTAAETTAGASNGAGPGDAKPTPESTPAAKAEAEPHLDPPPRIRILDVQPSVDGGRFDVKR